ncbi:MAG: hypothetical protein ACK55I_27665 [bacterium]
MERLVTDAVDGGGAGRAGAFHRRTCVRARSRDRGAEADLSDAGAEAAELRPAGLRQVSRTHSGSRVHDEERI